MTVAVKEKRIKQVKKPVVTVMPNYFDIKRDPEIEKAGGFFCEGCLVGKPAVEQSPDPRYCQGCYDFLLDEATLLPAGKRPKWVPKSLKPEKQQKPQQAPKMQYQVSRVGDGIMSTLESKKLKWT